MTQETGARAVWTALAPRRLGYELRRGDDVLATLRIVSWCWARVAEGTVLGLPWSLDERIAPNLRFTFRGGPGNAPTYVATRMDRLEDQDGRVYAIPAGLATHPDSVFDAAGGAVLEGHVRPETGEPELLLPEGSVTDPTVMWLALLLQYLRKRNWGSAPGV